MLEKVDLEKKLSKEEYQAVIGDLKDGLSAIDAPIRDAGLPVIILFEGWSGAGKGRMIQKLIHNFDPRWFRVVNTQPPTEVDRREPMMWRYWKDIPEKGKMSIMDRSWYQEVSTMRIENHVDELTNLRHMNEINNFERGLADNGYLIVKLFLHISEKEMKRRLDRLAENKDTAWRVQAMDVFRIVISVHHRA